MARRRRPTPTPAQIWRILHATAREARIARREYAEAMREIARLDAERKQAAEERERDLDRLFRRIGGEVDNRWGRLAEGLVKEDLVKLLRDAGVGVVDARHAVWVQRGGETREYDLVAYGEHDAVVVEVKTNLKSSDVSRFERQMRDFREWRPDYARARIAGAVACLTAEGRAARAAEAAGLYLIQVLGGTARIVNAEGFRPTLF